MSTKLVALAAIFTAGLTMPVFAQQAATLDDLDAERINANQITIDFEYTGGACEEVGPAVLGEETDGTLAVNFPITSTAEICTQQALEIDVEQTIEAPATVTRVDVTLTGADGNVVGTGSTDVDND
jgi:hypothetical protein